MSNTPFDDLREQRWFVALGASLESAAETLYSKYLFDGLAPQAAVEHVVRCLERSIAAASGPSFDEQGFLPPLVRCSEAEVMRWFGFSERRQELVRRIDRWIYLARAIKARRLLLDGSFVTAKGEPGDVDAVVLLPTDFGEQVRKGIPEAVELHGMLRAREPKELFAAEEEADWWAWFLFFSRTRMPDRRCKGLIEVSL